MFLSPECSARMSRVHSRKEHFAVLPVNLLRSRERAAGSSSARHRHEGRLVSAQAKQNSLFAHLAAWDTASTGMQFNQPWGERLRSQLKDV